jgi:transcription elongation factor/antiterminator RfaH
MSVAWYVLQTKPRKENKVFSFLKTRGINVYYPAIEVTPVNPRASKVRPLFPRYMFVYVDLDEIGISTLQWIPNAIGLVQFGEHPAVISENILHEIKARLVQVQETAARDDLKPGDLVRITDGPLAGYEAMFDMRLNGTDRVQVLLNMLGRLVKTRVDATAVEKWSNQRIEGVTKARGRGTNKWKSLSV